MSRTLKLSPLHHHNTSLHDRSSATALSSLDQLRLLARGFLIIESIRILIAGHLEIIRLGPRATLDAFFLLDLVGLGVVEERRAALTFGIGIGFGFDVQTVIVELFHGDGGFGFAILGRGGGFDGGFGGSGLRLALAGLAGLDTELAQDGPVTFVAVRNCISKVR